MTEVMGIGSYVGEIRQGPDGQLYEWVEGVDGLGNPIGFWRGLRRAFQRVGRGITRFARGAVKFIRPLARAALPFTKFIPGVGPAIYAAGTVAQRAGILGVGEPSRGTRGLTQTERIVVRAKIESGDFPKPRPGQGIAQALADYVFFSRYKERCPGGDHENPQKCRRIRPDEPETLKEEWRSIFHEVDQELKSTSAFRRRPVPARSVAARLGTVAQGPDGQLYEYVEGVDGLGNPVGFWRGLISRLPGLQRIRGVTGPFCQALPQLEPCVQQVPAARSAYDIGTRVCSALRRVGLAEAPDGQLYEYVEGVDGLGNPIGFWRGLRRAARGLAQRVTRLVPGAAQLLQRGLPGLIQRIPGIQRVTGYTRQFCQALPQFEPCARQVPAAMPAYQLGTRVCNTLRRFGLAGMDGGLMEAPDGQLYEVVEGIGAFGERRPYLRRVSLCIPAVIRPRRWRGQPRMARPAAPAAAAAAAPAPAFRRFR